MEPGPVAANGVIYTEKLTSNKTTALFLALMTLFLLLFIRRRNTRGWGVLAVVFLSLSTLFLFYVVNFRTLVIRLTSQALTLKFGLFTWKVRLEDIAACRLDEVPFVQRMGGAGIHFLFVRRRYRASFNFLEYPRVVIAFKQKIGPVQDLSFSTRRPEQVLQHLREAISASRAARGPLSVH